MARVSTKQNKNIYHTTRESLQLTREEASELLEAITPERIEKIENERTLPHPDEVLLMAEKYKQPGLCNYYCANQCPIGQQYVPEVKIKDLSQIVLEMLASLNSMQKKKERLIEITVDGVVSKDELEDFALEAMKIEGIDMSFIMLTNILERSTDLLAIGAGAGPLVNNAFAVESVRRPARSEDGKVLDAWSVELPGVVSRKKQLVPQLTLFAEQL